MANKTFSPDTKQKAAQGGKFLLYLLLGLLSAAMVIISIILSDVHSKYLTAAEGESTFAHSLSLVCNFEGLNDKYPTLCGDAQDYITNPDRELTESDLGIDGIKSIRCEPDQTVILYKSGKSTVVGTPCE